MDAQKGRFIAATVLAPLAPGLLLIAISLAGNPKEGIWAFLVTAALGYPAMILLGLPVHFLLARLRRRGVGGYLLGGTLIGVGVAVANLLPAIRDQVSAGFVRESLPSWIAFATVAAILGAISALTFWVIARPDHAFSIVRE